MWRWPKPRTVSTPATWTPSTGRHPIRPTSPFTCPGGSAGCRSGSALPCTAPIGTQLRSSRLSPRPAPLRRRSSSCRPCDCWPNLSCPWCSSTGRAGITTTTSGGRGSWRARGRSCAYRRCGEAGPCCGWRSSTPTRRPTGWSPSSPKRLATGPDPSASSAAGRRAAASRWRLSAAARGRAARPTDGAAGLVGDHVADDLADLEGGGVGADVDLAPRTVDVDHVLHGLQDRLHPAVVVGEDRLQTLAGLLTEGKVAADPPRVPGAARCYRGHGVAE